MPAPMPMMRDVGLLLVWLVFVVWSYTASPAPPPAKVVPPRPKGYPGGKVISMPDAPREPDSAPGFPVVADGPGKYRVSGVDRATKMDTSMVVHAESADNARVKVELEGVIVTKVEYQGRN